MGSGPGKIGMIGFSAGAFLVADVAVDPRAAPLAFVAPIYGSETQGRPVPADAPPLFTVMAQTTFFTGWPRVSTPTGPTPSAPQKCTSTGAATTGSAS